MKTEKTVSKKSKTASTKKFWNEIYRDRYLYMMMLLPMVFFVVFKYIPMFGTMIAFKDYKINQGILGSAWVGLKHFSALAKSADFYNIFGNTLLLSVLNIVCGFPVPIVLAILLNELRNVKFKKTVQSILYIPHFISWVILGSIITTMLSPSTGVINKIIELCGGEAIYFLADKTWWRIVYVLSGIWQSAGWGTIVYLAAITGIDAELYNAAKIDGANKWQQILHITLPGISGTICIILIMRMGSVLNLNFDQIFVLQNDMVIDISDVISTYEYRLGLLNMQYSYTTALGLFKGVIGLILVVTTNMIVNKISDGESGLW